jgi:hypothetical protein
MRRSLQRRRPRTRHPYNGADQRHMGLQPDTGNTARSVDPDAIGDRGRHTIGSQAETLKP